VGERKFQKGGMSPTALPRPPSWIWGPLRSREGSRRGTGREEKEKNTGMEERGSEEGEGGKGEGEEGKGKAGRGAGVVV